MKTFSDLTQGEKDRLENILDMDFILKNRENQYQLSKLPSGYYWIITSDEEDKFFVDFDEALRYFLF